MTADVEAVLRIRGELARGYRQALGAARGLAPGAIDQLDPQAFGRLFAELVGYVDDIADAHGFFERADPTMGEQFTPQWDAVTDQLAAEGLAEPRESTGTGPDMGIPSEELAPDPGPRQRTETQADRAFQREFARVMGGLDPTRGAPSAQRALVREYVNLVFQRYLEPAGIPGASEARIPLTGADVAADVAVGGLDPMRQLGYEMTVELPADLQLNGQQRVRADGLIWKAGERFEFAEHKSPVLTDVPAGHYNTPAGQLALLADLEVRGRLAQRIPACDGWRYSTDSPWLSDLIDYAAKRLTGRGGGDPPPAATEAFLAQLNTLAATPDAADWGSTIRVAP